VELLWLTEPAEGARVKARGVDAAGRARIAHLKDSFYQAHERAHERAHCALRAARYFSLCS